MLLEKHTAHKNTQITVKASWRERTVTMDEEKEVQSITPASMGIGLQERQRKCRWTFQIYAVLGRLESHDQRLWN